MEETYAVSALAKMLNDESNTESTETPVHDFKPEIQHEIKHETQQPLSPLFTRDNFDNIVYRESSVLFYVGIVLGIVFLSPFPFFCIGSIFLFYSLFILKRFTLIFEPQALVFRKKPFFGTGLVEIKCLYSNIQDVILQENQSVRIENEVAVTVMLASNNGHIAISGLAPRSSGKVIADAVRKVITSKK